MSYLQAAFDHVCEGHKAPEAWYVALVESYQAYGGPEEGGWYYTVSQLVAYKEYPTEELAHAAAAQVEEFAKECRALAQREHGELCLNQMEWLEARGLDADYLPENDGPDEYDVRVVSELPTFNNARPCYE